MLAQFHVTLVPHVQGQEALTLVCEGPGMDALLANEFDRYLTMVTRGNPNVPFRYENRKMVIGSHVLEITPVLEQASPMQGALLVGARVNVSIDGAPQPQLTYGVVGTGTSPQIAVEDLVVFWTRGIGAALVEAVGERPSADVHSGFRAYPGQLAIRGSLPQERIGMAPSARQIFSRLGPLAPEPRWQSLDLKIVVNGMGEVEGQCFLNGVDTPTLLLSLRALTWPPTDTAYMYKQAWVFARQSHGDRT